VPTATTAMRRTDARPVAIMGRVISMAASSWAWAHGRTGDTATAGVSIASAAEVEELTSKAVETKVDVVLPRIGETGQR